MTEKQKAIYDNTMILANDVADAISKLTSGKGRLNTSYDNNHERDERESCSVIWVVAALEDLGLALAELTLDAKWMREYWDKAEWGTRNVSNNKNQRKEDKMGIV